MEGLGAMAGKYMMQPQGNYLQRQLQRFTGGLQRGTERLMRGYENTDRKYYGGNLPFGAPPDPAGFMNSLPGYLGAPRDASYGLPGVSQPVPGFMTGGPRDEITVDTPPAHGADFIGPRSNELPRR